VNCGERNERQPIQGSWGGAPGGVLTHSPWSGCQGALALNLKAFPRLNVYRKYKVTFSKRNFAKLKITDISGMRA